MLGTSFDSVYIFDGEHLILRHAEDSDYEFPVYVQTIDVKIYDGYVVFDGMRYLAADSEALKYDASMELEELEQRARQRFESRCEAHGVDRTPF